MDAIPTMDSRLLVAILIVYMVALVVNLALRALAHQLGGVNIIDGAKNARVAVVKKIQDLDFAFHTTKSTGSLISSIKRRDGAFFGLFHTLHFQVLSTSIGFLVMIYVFGRIDYRILVIIINSISISLLVANFIVFCNILRRKLFLIEEDKITGVIVDNMVNFETVKYFANESHERARLAGKFTDWRGAL